MAKKNYLKQLSSILVIIGAIAWGLVAINPSWNIVEMIFQGFSRIVYGLIGIAGAYTALVMLKVMK